MVREYVDQVGDPGAGPVAPTEPPLATTTPRRTDGRWVAAIALGFVALVVGLLALPGGQVVGDTTSNITNTTVLPNLEPGEPVIQPFVASNDDLSAVYATFGTYAGSARCDLDVSLVERSPGGAPGTGETLAQQDWSCAVLPDTGPFQVLSFEPQSDSAGRTYDVVIERTDAGPGPGVTLWAGTPRGDSLPVVLDGVTDPELSTAVRGEYDPQPHQWDRLSTLLDRLADYGPAWGTAGGIAGLLVVVGVLLSLGPVARRSTTAVVLVVVALAIARGFVWSAAVPQLEAMDEPAHFAYVQFLAEQREFPGKIDNHEIFSPRLHGAVAELNVESTTPGDRPPYVDGAEEEIDGELAALSPEGGGGGPGSMYAPFYYLPAVLLYEAGGDDILTQISLVRLWSVALGAFAAVLLVLIGRRLFPTSSGAQLAFVVAGVMQPMIAHQFAIVNNDGWVIIFGFAALATALELARRGRAPWLALLAGVILGGALLGKPFAVACAVPLGVGWLVGKIRARQRSVRVIASEIGLVIVGFLGTYGAWTATAARLQLNTSEAPAQTASGQSVREFLLANFGGELRGFRMMWADQLWGDFGWVRIPLPHPVPTVIFVVEVLVAVGFVAWLVTLLVELVARRRRTSVPGAPDTAVDVPAPRTEAELRAAPLPLDVRLLIVGVTIAAIVGTLYAAGWVYYSSTGQNDLLQGRYALLAVPAFIAAPALLLERLSRERVKPVVVNVLLAAAMVAINLLGLVMVFEAFYG